VATPRTGVLLFDEAADLLKKPLTGYLRKSDFGSYLNCVSVDASGPFLSLVVEPDKKILAGAQPVEVQIPYSFVRLTMRGTSKNPMGFAET
jgi:hypothetical protein